MSKPKFTPGPWSKEVTEMHEALKQLVHLHLCEQEGLASGMPTTEQWISAVDEAARVLRKIEWVNHE